MTPYRTINTTDAKELTQQLAQLMTTPERFSISLPYSQLTAALAAAYQCEVVNRRRTPDLDESTISHIRAAAEWLGDPRGKTGLLLQGLYGNGKTTLMRAICRLVDYLFASPYSAERRSIRLITAMEIARLGSRDESRSAYRKLFEEPLLAIDDLGEDPAEIMSYGMILTPVKDLLLERYARNRFTIASTNLVNTKENPQLATHYGARLVDRFREMMKIIVFTNPSFRGR